MAGTNAVELGSVQKTLLLPLWGRAVEAAKPHPLLVDRTAARIIASIDYDFSTIARNTSPITRLAWIARSLHADRTLREFLSRHPDATVVNLGCGMDTTFERVDNGRLHWYDLDLPDVIAFRGKLIEESDRRHSIAASLLDDSWFARLNAPRPVFFLAAGVLYYFAENEVRAFLIGLLNAFAGSELLFDACSPWGCKVANKKVIEASGMDASAVLRWGLRQAADLQRWDNRIAVLADYPMFHNMKRELSLHDKWGTFLSDRLGVMSMVHLRLGGGE